MLWVKHILNNDFNSFWKHIEISALKSFHHDVNILFKSHAPSKKKKKKNLRQNLWLIVIKVLVCFPCLSLD